MDLITPEEELTYLSFYSKNLIPAANFFKMPTQVKATAISFFKKFYLHNSTMKYHPKNVLFTCLFLAAKLENYFISIESFCKALPKTEPHHILDLEFTVLQALKFTLLVHHPFRPLYGFFLDFQLVLLHPQVFHDVTVDTLGELYDKAKRWLNEAMLSDGGFLFTPPQIALAAMWDCDRRVTERYLRLKYGPGPSTGPSGPGLGSEQTQETQETQEQTETQTERETETKEQTEEAGPAPVPNGPGPGLDLLVTTIKKCVKLCKQIHESTKEESTKIDGKCFFAINPERLIKKRVKGLKAELASASEAVSEAASAEPVPAVSSSTEPVPATETGAETVPNSTETVPAATDAAS